MNYIYDPKEKGYTILQVAKELKLKGIWVQNLSYYLNKLGIIYCDLKPYSNSIADSQYLEAGFFKIAISEKNSQSYLQVIITESGLNWIKEIVVPKILKVDEEYLSMKKKIM